jgi:hypothetical protein
MPIMLLLSPFKGAVRIAALASAVLLGLTPALAASNPGPMRAGHGGNLAEPAFTLGKATSSKTKTWLKKNTRPLGTLKTNPGPPDMRKVQPGPPETRKVNPGPPERRKINPGLPAVQGR